jgi:hypothetical protein
MFIRCTSTEQMVEVVSGLVQKGLTFEVMTTGYGWEIKLTGGY